MQTQTIDISKLDKAAVLAALYNASRQQGMGFMDASGRNPMTVSEAAELLRSQDYFDYLRGRVMKVRIEDALYPGLYDRDNGDGAAAYAINALRGGNENSMEIVLAHKLGTERAAAAVLANLDKETTLETGGGVASITLGLSDVAKELGPKVAGALEKLS